MSPQFISLKTLVLLSAIGLTACGGGGGDSADSTAPAPVVTTPADSGPNIVNPTDDMKAKVGESFSYSIPENFCKHDGGDTVETSITQVSNASGLSIINFQKLEGKPVAPGVISVTVTCKTTDAAVQDTFKITVTEDNVAPTVDAGEPQKVESGTPVSLSAMAEDSNTDGTIASYKWEQTGTGIAVDTIMNSDKAQASFTAPDVEQTETLTFTVTVTDNEGAVASDSVEITIESQYLPDVTIDFPSAYGVVSSAELDVFGSVVTKNEATLASVKVLSGSTEYNAVIDSDGAHWRAENVAVADLNELTIIATDSNGLARQLLHPISADKTTATSLDNDLVDIGLNAQTNKLYIQTSGFMVSDVATLVLDLSIGELESLDVQKAAGFESNTIVSFYLDVAGNRFFSSTGDAILTTDLNSLEQTIVSANDTEYGPVVGLATELTAAPDNQIFIVDNNNHQILSLEPATGLRSLIVDQADSALLDAPISAIFNQTANRLIVANNYFSETPFIQVDPETKVSTELSGSSADTVGDLAVTQDGNSLFYIKNSDLVRFDMATAAEQVIVEEISVDAGTGTAVMYATGLSLDESRGLLYVAAKDPESSKIAITVVDIKTGDYIKL